MADHTAPEILARLATLETRLAAQETELAHYRRRRRYGRAGRRALPLMLATLLVTLVPLATLAANPFTDLTGGPHDANIDAIYNAGITTGCDPGVAYCPTENVTREEMASFLARTAGLGGNPPVANAATAQTAANAGNAGTLGGFAPSGLVRASRAGGSATTEQRNAEVVLFTLAIVAPGPGVVVITAGASGQPVGTGGSTCPCAGSMLLRHVQADAYAPFPARVAIASFFDPQADTDSASLSYAFPVAAGPNTFEVRGQSSSTTARIRFDGQGTALFVPFGADGATP